MTGLFFRGAAGGRAGPVILLLATVVLQLAALPPARADGGSFSVEPVSLTEPVGGGARDVVFTVTLARSGADRVTVHYETADGTATAGRDYLSTGGVLDFGTAGTTRTVRVPVLGDGLDEADESFVLHLSDASTGQAAVDGTATITDADPRPQLSIGDARVVEGDRGTVGATFPVSLSEPSGQVVTVNYASSNGSGPNGTAGGAVAPDDYATSAGTLTFAPGDRMKPVVVPVTGDVTDEGNETFTVTLTDPANAAAGDTTATGTIVDDDGAPALSVEDTTAGEGGGHLTFKVSLDHPTAQDVTFRVQTVDGTAPNGATAPGDYSALAGSAARITAGGTSVGVDVPLTNDNVHEAPETFTMVASDVANATVARPAGTGTITDDDHGPDLSVADVSAPESTLVGGRLDFTVSLSASAGAPVTVDYATADGTALSQPQPPDEPDYTATSGTLTFKPGESNKMVTVFLNPDGRAEGDETVLLNLSNPSMGVALVRPTATGTIDNDDGPPDELTVSDVTVAEGDGGTAAHLFTVTRARKSGAFVPPTVSVRYATADGTATAGRDYAPRTGLLIFSGSATTQTVSVSVRGDLADEDDETFTVTLANPTNAVLAKDTGTATIVDDDDAPRVAVTPVTVPEGNSGAGRGVVDITLSAPSSRPVTVGYAVGGGTASAADYSADTNGGNDGGGNGTVAFDPGETTKELGFSVLGDTLDEPDETFTVTLSNPVNATLGAPDGTVTITDDDAPPALALGDETITETDAAGGPLIFTVALERPSGQAVSVTVATADGPSPGGASAPGDYTAVPGQFVTIPAGATAATVAVPVIDDPAQDGAPSETFAVNLATPVNATVADGAATGTIVDNDGPATVSITGATVTEGSGGPNKTAALVVSLSKESDQPITVDYATADGAPPGGAEAPADYGARTGTVTFTPGKTSETIAVDVAADTTDEADEAFTVALSNASGGTPIDPARTVARAAILDDDGPDITLADIKVTEGNEGDGPAEFAVTLGASSPQPVTVDFATANGTAAGGSDYTPVSGTLTFFPGETSQTVAVPVIGDTVNEGDEDFALTLSGPVNGTVTTTAGRAGITDDDLSRLDIADAAIAEGDNGAATLTFTVALTPPTIT
ncbi:MAG: hypothetical protein LC792_00615, partial [Actinobacteria bacterium]|nr:hypothetical protein [Actinomycetota bacterium]